MTPAEQASHLLRVASRRMSQPQKDTLALIRDGFDIEQPELDSVDHIAIFRRIITEFAADLK